MTKIALNLQNYSMVYEKSGYEFKDLNLAIKEGEIVGIVGESGCGKSTIGKILVGLINQTELAGFGVRELSGSLKSEFIPGDTNYLEAKYRELRALRRHVQMIFQNHRASLNLNVRVYNTLLEAIKIGYGNLPSDEIDRKIMEVCRNIGLIDNQFENIRDSILIQKNRQLSGGQMKRVSIAKAICLNPDVIIADEPLTGLDASKRGKILKFFIDEWNTRKNTEKPLTLIIISHDIGMIAKNCERIIVMYGDLVRKRGAIVEEFIGNQLLLFNIKNNYHPYTQELINAANYFREKGTYIPKKRILNSVNMNQGCVYNMYCSKLNVNRCIQTPRLEPVNGNHQHRMACLFP